MEDKNLIIILLPFKHKSSQCIDAGDPSSYLDPDGTIADIGAYFFNQGLDVRLIQRFHTSLISSLNNPLQL